MIVTIGGLIIALASGKKITYAQSATPTLSFRC